MSGIANVRGARNKGGENCRLSVKFHQLHRGPRAAIGGVGGGEAPHNLLRGFGVRQQLEMRRMRHEPNLKFYIEYHGDLVRHSLLKYWYEVGTKFDDCGTKFIENSTEYIPEVIKGRP